ncbi:MULTISPECIES: hypothetical protein [Leptospira]|uniref:Uncharacterized protein n=1 Tax=Leptospira licerasiae str. MMD4847 TaxID=1049971 RepID=A0ABP2RGQ0_9LEPT|nr:MULTISPECIES: hypothetical protein [Leptospira]EIE01361.1 hypothetical protein LEP1GSC185_3462 [Leptospira licerasiae serovar Varillal str. VAR 010]EJZ43636.1 hypothetical protein LEP1GSC178_3075 [Leptospira licerasiae str. MMD4847]
MTNYNLQYIEDFLGIDRVCFFTPYGNIKHGSGAWGLNTPPDQKVETPIARLGNSGIAYRRMQHTVKQDLVYFWFSYSRLFNGINLSSYTPVGRLLPLNDFISIAEENGISFKSSDEIHLATIEIFSNIQLEHPYPKYYGLFRTMILPRMKLFSYADTVYLGNRQSKIKTYDKTNEVFNRHGIGLNKNFARIELTIKRKAKVSKLISKAIPQVSSEDDMAEYFGYPYNLIFQKVYYDNIEKAFKKLLKFDFKPNSGNLRDELVSYYKNKKSPSKWADKALNTLSEIRSIGLGNVFAKRLEEIEAQATKPFEVKGKMQRVRKEILDLYSDALLIEHQIKFGPSLLEELRRKMILQRKKMLIFGENIELAS